MTDHPITETDKEFQSVLQEMCGPNDMAFAWLTQAIRVTMLYDHIIDEDGFTKEEVHESMRHMLIDWPLNSFYVKNAPILGLIAVNVISAWKHSNNIDAWKVKSYDALTEIPCTTAFLLGGHDLVDKFMPRIRDLADKLLAEDEARDGFRK